MRARRDSPFIQETDCNVYACRDVPEDVMMKMIAIVNEPRNLRIVPTSMLTQVGRFGFYQRVASDSYRDPTEKSHYD